MPNPFNFTMTAQASPTPLNTKTMTTTPQTLIPQQPIKANPATSDFGAGIGNGALPAGAPVNPYATMGVQAKSPQNNLTAPSNSLSSSQQYVPPPSTQSQNSISGNSTQSGASSPYSQYGLYGQLIGQASTDRQRSQQAQDAAIAFNKSYNQGMNNISNKPIALEFQQGQQAAMQRDYGVQAKAASETANAAQQQYASDIGLAGQVAPQLSQYGQRYYMPGQEQSGGQAVSAANDPQFYSAMQQYAQMMATGQGGAVPSSITSNPVLAAQLQQMAHQANPYYNYNAAQGIGSAQAQQGQQFGQYQSVLGQGQNLQLQLKNLINTFGINPNDINALNTGLQRIAQNTSSPEYQKFSNLVNEIANTYAQALTPAGGSTTDMSRSIAQHMLDSSASGQSIIDVMTGLDSQLQAKMAGTITTGSGGGGGGNAQDPLGIL